MAHRDRWCGEERPIKASLPRLTPEELAVHTDLVTDALGERVRLEQERID
ncbi:Wadjet anti-phage system protein JetD domain-containing protein, partial [Nocardioides sp.]